MSKNDPSKGILASCSSRNLVDEEADRGNLPRRGFGSWPIGPLFYEFSRRLNRRDSSIRGKLLKRLIERKLQYAPAAWDAVMDS
jgi:hypothetical protein